VEEVKKRDRPRGRPPKGKPETAGKKPGRKEK
jgi:hypothetical protein